jgi:hypothetical protein
MALSKENNHNLWSHILNKFQKYSRWFNLSKLVNWRNFHGDLGSMVGERNKKSIIILISVHSFKVLDEESLERLLQHQSWSVSILFWVLIEYTWPISFKLVYSFICLSIVALL